MMHSMPSTNHTYYGRPPERRTPSWLVIATAIATAGVLATVLSLVVPTPAHSQEVKCGITWNQLVEVSDELVANHPNVKEGRGKDSRQILTQTFGRDDCLSI
jgi:hypothetical protein